MPAILLCRSGDDAGLAHPILEDRCLIGRGSDCSLSLLHPQLSREHAAVLRKEGGGLEVEDLRSQNGTQLNGEPLQAGEPRPLAHLDRITLGGDLEFVILELARVPQSEVLAAHLLDPTGERIPLQLGENTMGSDEDCDLIVADPAVAATLLKLDLSASGLVLSVDPAAGTVQLNGEPVEGDRRLADGDYIELSNKAEFGIELIHGFAEVRTPDPAEQTSPHLPSATSGEPPVREEPPVDHDSTETLEAGEIREALARARARHEAEMARRVKSRREAQEEGTSGPGTQGYAIDEEENATLRRTWASRSAPMPRPAPAQNFQAVRRESAARLMFRLPGSEEEQGRLLREGKHVVGRHDGCRVVFHDETVSREHAQIDVGPQGIVVTDLGSANGTWRGAERIDRATFQDGDEVRFGAVQCRFELI